MEIGADLAGMTRIRLERFTPSTPLMTYRGYSLSIPKKSLKRKKVLRLYSLQNLSKSNFILENFFESEKFPTLKIPHLEAFPIRGWETTNSSGNSLSIVLETILGA